MGVAWSEGRAAHRTKEAAQAVAAVTAGIVMGAAIYWAGTSASEKQPLEPCATEDQETPCYWDASERRNGIGTDFIVWDGQTYTRSEQ